MQLDDIRFPLARVAIHGSQRRSEAAVPWTNVGRSPGDLDMVEYTDALNGVTQ